MFAKNQDFLFARMIQSVAGEMETDTKGNVIWMELITILSELGNIIYLVKDQTSKLIQAGHSQLRQNLLPTMGNKLEILSKLKELMFKTERLLMAAL